MGLITTALITIGTVLLTPRNAISLLPAIVISALMARTITRSEAIPLRLTYGFLLGALAQGARLAVRCIIGMVWGLNPLPSTALLSVPANGLGLALLFLIISDAQVRADSEQHRIEIAQQRAEAERAQALATEAQMSALRARVRPHFLFNALNAITELCCIAPERAEIACLNLSQLMRWTLNTSTATVVPLREELALTRAYIQIEQERLGERLRVIWETRSLCEEAMVIPFSLQILVENAINHGLGTKLEGGTVSITIRCSARRTLVAVSDDGVGMPPEACALVRRSDSAANHGLQLSNQQLVLRYGIFARLRFFSRPGEGTLAIFAVPIEKRTAIEGGNKEDDHTDRR